MYFMRMIKHGTLVRGCADACCLKLEGLSVQLEGDSILSNVFLHLHCGEIVALIGEGSHSNVSPADMTPRTKRIIEHSALESRQTGQNYRMCFGL